MKAFHFSLERVLEWRRTELSLEEAKLQKLNAQRLALDAARAELVRRGLEAHRNVSSALSVRGQALAELEAYRRWAVREESALAARTAELQLAINRQSRAAVEADRKVRVVERLRERRHREWDALAQHELEEMAAEAALARWRRDY